MNGRFAASENALSVYFQRLMTIGSFCGRRGKYAQAVSYWVGLILGVSTAAWGQPSDTASIQPAPPIPPATTAPSETVPEPTAASPQQLDEFLRLVTGKNEPDVRLMGARRLLEAGRDANQTEMVADRLVGVLTADPPDLSAQTAVCEAVADASAPPVSLIEPLLSLLGGGDARPGLNQAVTHALRRFESGLVIHHVQRIATDTGAAVERRKPAVRALGETGDRIEAVAALVQLTQDSSEPIRQEALRALTRATGVRHVDAAGAAAWWEAHKSMSQPQWLTKINELRGEQIRTLRERAGKLTNRLVASYRESYVATAEADRLAKLLVYLGDGLSEIRNLGLDLINVRITDRKELSGEIKARLLEMIADPVPELRRRAVGMVGDLRLTDAVPALLKALAAEPDYRLRAAQISAVGRLDGVTAIKVLIRRLDDQAPAVVSEAALALARISRRVHDNPQTVDAITTALSKRFEKVSTDDEALRVRFLEAMTLVGAECFRTVFQREMEADRLEGVRQAAIFGMGNFADTAAADAVEPLIGDSSPPIRRSATEALGRCGRRRSDLNGLSNHLDSAGEADQAVRDAAWESYIQVASRLPPQDIPVISDLFAKKGDPVAQRRRLDLLRLLTGPQQKIKKLSAQQQIGVLERVADAQSALGDATAAAASLEQALALAADSSRPEYAPLTARLVAALFHGGRDEAVVESIAAFSNVVTSTDSPVDPSPVVQAVAAGVRSRSQAASDAAAFQGVLAMIDALSGPAGALGSEYAETLSTVRGETVARRDAAMDRLLDKIANDDAAQAGLLAYGKDLVLPKLHAKLAGMSPTTTAPADTVEDDLIGLARQLEPQWPGYELGCPAEQRANALDQLKATWSSSPPPKPPVSPTTAPSGGSPSS